MLSLIGCTTRPAVSGILRTQAGRRGSGPGRWAGRDPPPHAGGYGCLLGRLRPRRIAGTIATVGPARGGSGAGSGPELPRVDRHQRRLRGRGSVGPDLSLARLLGGRLVLLIASSARLRWPGVTGSGAARIPPLRVGPGQRAGHAGRPTGSLESVDPRARATCATVSASDSRGRLPGCRRRSRGRCLLDCGARLGPGLGPRPGGRTRARRTGPRVQDGTGTPASRTRRSRPRSRTRC